MELIKLENITKKYNKNVTAINNLSLSIKEGEFVTLIGPSGCGKTTLLKLMNGLLIPDEGKIYIRNKEIKDWNPIALKRSIGYVIQQIGLFPHMTVSENIGYVLNIKEMPKVERYKKAEELIKIVGLDNKYLERYPRELSGGQKQRIGVARALAADPDIILMDEPFGAVDEITRKILQDEILDIFSMLKKTIVFVTHDIEEAFKLGTRIVLLNEGKIAESGSMKEILGNHQNQFTKKFFGLKSFTAYLKGMKVKEICNYNEYRNEDAYQNQLNFSIDEEASVIEGLKSLLEHKADKILVRNNKNEIIGAFSFEDIKNNM